MTKKTEIEPEQKSENKLEAKSEKKVGITVKKNENFSEWFTQVVGPEGAELADVRYGVQGFVVHMPWSMRILRRLYEYLEDEIEKDGHEPMLFPTVIKKENLEREKEHAGFAPDVFWVTAAGDKKLEEEVALRPTGETQIYPMYSLWLRGNSQLPYKRYQSRITVFRNEKTTRPFLRGREFMFFETHNMYATHEDVMEQIESDRQIMKRVYWDKLRLPHIFLIRPQWDKFLGANNTYVSDTLMPDGRRNQMSSTHDLGQNFAKAYDIKFTDKDGEIKYAHQSCFGPGIWRIMAALIGIHGDDNGLILPFEIAPYQIVIVPVLFSNEEENRKIIEKCDELEEELKQKYRVYFDNSNNTPGWKYNQWEMKGVPIRIELGPKDLKEDKIVLVRRTGHKTKTTLSELDQTIKQEAMALDDDIKSKAEKYFAHNTKTAETLSEIKSTIKSFRGFVKAPFCSIDKDGEGCADIIKAETEGAYVCGIPWLKEEQEQPRKGAVCAVCKKTAKHIVYIAKSW